MPFLIFAFVGESLLIHSSRDKNPKNSRDCFYHLFLLLRCYYSAAFRNQNISPPLSLLQKIFLRYLGCACPFLLPGVQNSGGGWEGRSNGNTVSRDILLVWECLCDIANFRQRIRYVWEAPSYSAGVPNHLIHEDTLAIGTKRVPTYLYI